jgi:hypothetical protein
MTISGPILPPIIHNSSSVAPRNRGKFLSKSDAKVKQKNARAEEFEQKNCPERKITFFSRGGRDKKELKQGAVVRHDEPSGPMLTKSG